MLGHEDRTFTLVGTPCYTAPEVLLGRGYCYQADYWSLGICLFELICGFLPYGEDAKDLMEVYEQITL